MEGYETVFILESLLRKALEFQSLQHNDSTSSARYGGNWYPRGGNHGPKRGGTETCYTGLDGIDRFNADVATYNVYVCAVYSFLVRL